MNSCRPPRILERLLLLTLSPRDRDTISGDLLEEYRDERLPRFGSIRANLWYTRQALSLASVRLWGGSRWGEVMLNRAVASASCLTLISGVWLFTMEFVLRHDGYPQRAAFAFAIALQSAASLLCLLQNRTRLLGLIVAAGSLLFLYVGITALRSAVSARHFEGFAVVIAAALIVQSLTMLAALYKRRQKTA